MLTYPKDISMITLIELRMKDFTKKNHFVLLTPDLPTRSCSDKPKFLDPTPLQNDVLVYRPGDIVYLSFYATSRAATIRSFTLLDPPTNVRQSALRNDDRFRPDVYAIDITWSPVAADRGSKTICVEATDNFMMSTQHCVTLFVWDINPCDSLPCQNNGTCERQRYTDNYYCACVPDIDECEAQPCEHGGTCVDLVGSSVCLCKPGFTGTICQTGVDSCETLPCENDGICRYNESSGYMCECLDGWVGRNCGYRLENETFFLGNKTGMTDEYIHYSDCDCVLGSGRQEYCYMYTLNKHSGFGILAILLGILSSIILYFLFYCVFDGFHNRISQDRVQDEKDEASDKHPPQIEKSAPEKLDAPKQRRHHCWACEVKYNNAPAPLWYKKDYKRY
ncbi:FBP1-like protein [Mya arenaria]|uniref:FBP1-like protein n=1 Tax=Mya arenaria TaxID=6604 RepID=A0ABY7FZM3_MYAAR|nr:FBP1-like protein [Mya arenaria]